MDNKEPKEVYEDKLILFLGGTENFDFAPITVYVNEISDLDKNILKEIISFDEVGLLNLLVGSL